jgi:hypothetical protein
MMDVLSNPDDEAQHQAVAAAVADLCSRFPLHVPVGV